MNKILTITLCGSLSRAGDELAVVHRALALAAHLVHAPVPPLPGEDPATEEQIHRLNLRHKAAIDRSDLVPIVAPAGYFGESTFDEFEYAAIKKIPTIVLVNVVHEMPRLFALIKRLGG